MESYLRDRSWSISQFAQIAGVNSGALSRTLNGNKSLSMMELNRITAALGLPEP
ncbi:helix-turn-helix domain-containing protein [Paenibacillus campinasensis]|uniref:helix-turn-helix domain-containing protein n=1 Tax=Paenibacillus TaxID=44249 RepID=UPI0039B6EC5D